MSGAVRCGDRLVGAGEQCDDGGVVPGDGCSATCQTEAAGSCPSGMRLVPAGMFLMGSTDRSDEHFLCFACGGDGSLLAVQVTDGRFESGPVVHLGPEGEVFVIADDVPHALALIAASGDNYEGLIYALTYSEAEPVEADAGPAAFVKAQFDVELPTDAIAAIKATDARLGEATRALIERLNDG